MISENHQEAYSIPLIFRFDYLIFAATLLPGKL